MENKILTFAKSLPEHRMDRRKLHLAEDIVYITLAAVICGADTWEDISDFGKSKEDFLKDTLSLKNGIPSPDTFNRFFAGLNPSVFEANFIAWVKSLCSKNSGVVAIDGKTVRGSRKEGNKSAIHMVSAFAAANGLVLGQVKTNQKSNEITAIPELLKVLDIEGCIITIDAMGCQTKIASAIVEKEADYILAVKDNQKELYTDIVDTFRFAQKDKIISHEDIDIGHGRVETPICTVTNDLSLLTGAENWKDINALVKIESTRFIKVSGETQSETRYYITSCKPNPESIGKAVRSHWGIENKLHWQLDVSFGEDKSRKRDRNAAENYSVILRMALNIIKNEKSSKRGVKGKRLKAGWDNQYLMKLLDFQCVCPAYVLLLLPRYGLCNKLLTWSKALVLVHKKQKTLLVRGWVHFSFGPWLRCEKSKRWYAGLLRQTPFVKFWGTKILHYDSLNYKMLLQDHQSNTDGFQETPYISDLPLLAKHHWLIKKEFDRLIHPKQLSAIEKIPFPFIGIHVRRGDYVTIGSTTDLIYFQENIRQLRLFFGQDVPVTIFSDGNTKELFPLLSMPNVTLFESQSDLIDLVVLSKSEILITSKASSYSYWAAFISEGIVIHHPDTWVPQCRPATINSTRFEGPIPKSGEWPDQLINNLKSIKMNEIKTIYKT